jgi:NAD(P)-dependent dehydrogenase (short-subunit alcohol dehydrogenase family)
VELGGRRALVTGGAGGLGEVVVRALAARGMTVVVVDVERDAAHAVASQVGGLPVVADLGALTGAEDVLSVVDGELDVLVNLAGGWGSAGRSFPEASVAEWQAVLTLNLLTPMRLLSALRPALAASPVGAAVCIASSAALSTGAYGSPEYAVAKAGVVRLTSALADWPERYGVRVSCIVPGWIGLPRAIAEVQAMSPADRPALIAPELIATEVLRLIDDPQSGGQILVMNEEMATESFAAPGLRLT